MSLPSAKGCPGARILANGGCARIGGGSGNTVSAAEWLGSCFAQRNAANPCGCEAALGFGQLDGTGRALVIAAVLVYVFGVHAPTVTINIPLNNKVQTLAIADMDEAARSAARRQFESRWNASNTTRTVLASLVTVLLLILLLRL